MCEQLRLENAQLRQEIQRLQQSRAASLTEVLINVGTGFMVSYILWLTLIPLLFNIDTNASQGLGVTAVYTVASIVRGYVVRRGFNAHKAKGKESA